MISIRDNILRVQERIAHAAVRAGRKPEDITLVAVTKTHPVAAILEAVFAGLNHFGENRIQESIVKIPAFNQSVHWHLIGHLQSNKVKQALSLFEMIQSVDSVRLAQVIGEQSLKSGKKMPVLIEVNTSGEQSKFGVSPEKAPDIIAEVASLEGIELLGLMTIGPFTGEPEDARSCFQQLTQIKDKAIHSGISSDTMKYLSMGMTSDFEIAIEEGANILRIGSAIFGERKER